MVREMLLVMALWGMTGCVAVPHSESPLTMRPGVSGKADYAFIEPGKTRRLEVLMRLGEPDGAWANDRVLLYRWAGSEILVLYAMGYGYTGVAGEFEIPKVHALMVAFDEEGKVTRIQEYYDKAFDWVKVEKITAEWIADAR